MDVLVFIMVLVFSYLLGSIPFGYLIARIFKKIDIRKHGSHNIGATNVFRVVGKVHGSACLILDISKGVISVIFISDIYYGYFNNFMPLTWLKIIFGLTVIIGHIWPIYLNFKGGKGVATAFGVLLGISPISVLASFVIWVIVVFFTRIVSLGSISAAIFLPFIEAFRGESISIILFTLLILIIVIFRHRENINRLIKKNENKI